MNGLGECQEWKKQKWLLICFAGQSFEYWVDKMQDLTKKKNTHNFTFNGSFDVR